jgi:fatty acid omega-hydroxy dehydrogenase
MKENVNIDTKSVEQFCRDTMITIWHYHGGCHVGKVSDSNHKVLGVDRLSVVDGSTFTESPRILKLLS